IWATQLDVWDESARRLGEAASEMRNDADVFSHKTLAFFQVSNEGHIGSMPTQHHANVLASSFDLWITDYRAGLDSCTGNLREGLVKLRTFHGAMITISETVPTGSTTFPIDQ